MTTIIYKDRVILGDRLVTEGGIVFSAQRKVGFTRWGGLWGASGTAAWVDTVRAWAEDADWRDPEDGSSADHGHPPRPSEGQGEAILVDRLGGVRIVDDSGVFRAEFPYFCLGSGAIQARTALSLGLSPEIAMRAAAGIDRMTSEAHDRAELGALEGAAEGAAEGQGEGAERDNVVPFRRPTGPK